MTQEFSFILHLAESLIAFLIICPSACKLFIVSRTTKPISTKLSTKILREKGIQFCSDVEPHPYLRVSNSKNILTKYEGPLCQFQPNLAQSWMKGIPVCSNEGPHPLTTKYQKYVDKILKICWAYQLHLLVSRSLLFCRLSKFCSITVFLPLIEILKFDGLW